MIQRLQSLFLFLASCAFFLVFVFDFVSSNIKLPGVLSDQVYDVMDNGILIGLTALGGIVTLVSIFLFKNRTLQIRLSYLSILLALLLPVVAFVFLYRETSKVSNIELNSGVATFLPIAVLLFVFLALRFIKKDDKLVKSMDRLR